MNTPARGGAMASGMLERVAALASAAILALALLYAGYYHATIEILPYDDAFITYRYVANFFSGHGLVYNTTERVFGSTTPLYVLWLIAARAVTGVSALPLLAVRSNALFYIAAASTLVGLGRRLMGSWIPALWLGTLFAFHPEMLEISSGGMEPFLLIALSLGALWALADGRLRLAGALAGLAAVTRPEGLAIGGVWGLYWLFQRRKDWVALALAGAPLAVWVIGATLYYGTPVPHSLIAKSAPVYDLPSGHAWQRILGQLLSWSILRPFTENLTIVPILTALAIVGMLGPREMRRRGGGMAVFWVLVVAMYAQANTLMFEWYYPLIYALWMLTIIVGLPSLFTWIHALTRARFSPLTVRWVVFIIAFFFVAFDPVQLDLYFLVSGGTISQTVVKPDRQRILAYQTAVEWLNTISTEATSIASPEVGAVGYYFRGHVYDACGLVSPQALPHLPPPRTEGASGEVGLISRAFIKAVEADYVVVIPSLLTNALAGDYWFSTHYALAKKVALPVGVWRSREVLIFAHQRVWPILLARTLP